MSAWRATSTTLIQAEGPETVAGFLAEPVTGGGGVVVPPPGYYDAMQRVLDSYGIPFFADEVVTGFCRTGSWFGCETFGIRPQTMSLGKGLSSAYQPIAALVVSSDIYEGLEKGSDNVGTFAHGATYSGHPVAAAVALRCVQLMEERDVLGHVRQVMPTFERRLRTLGDHPLVGDVRVCGLMGAVEFVADKATTAPVRTGRPGRHRGERGRPRPWADRARRRPQATRWRSAHR